MTLLFSHFARAFSRKYNVNAYVVDSFYKKQQLKCASKAILRSI